MHTWERLQIGHFIIIITEEQFWWYCGRHAWATWWWAALSGSFGWRLESSPGEAAAHYWLPTALALFKRAVAAIEKAAWRETGEGIYQGRRGEDDKNWGRGVYNERTGPAGGENGVNSDNPTAKDRKRTGVGWGLGDQGFERQCRRRGWEERGMSRGAD